MKKSTRYGSDARTAVLEGIRKITDAVKVTLGPLGRNVLISRCIYTDNYVTVPLPLHVTKDGYTTTRSFDLEDPFERAGVLLVKEAAQRTVDQAGDGTTSTVVLLEAIAKAGLQMIEDGANPIQLKREIDDAVAFVVAELKKQAVQIGDDNEKIFHIATISANNDTEIGRMIADAFKKIGSDGIIELEAGKNVNTEITTADGYRFDKSFVSPMFINNREKQICEYENPLIVLYQKQIIHHTQYERAAKIAKDLQRPIIFICEDAREEGLATLVINNHNHVISTCVIKAPSFGYDRDIEMEDIAILTGGTYISDSKGFGIAEIEFENMGQCDKIRVTKEETIIIGGRADQDLLEAHMNELKMNLAEAKNEDQAAPIENRIARLQGGVAIIAVGAPTETEMRERLDRFDDAVRATKAAISEGYLPGAGSVYWNIMADMDGKTQGNRLIKSVLSIPFEQICKNAGVDFSSEQLSFSDKNHGYNAKTGKWENLVESGVIDPAKVLRCALQNAASSASMLLTTECLIADQS